MLEELIIRTLCDTLPSAPVDAVYLFAQTTDNQEASFKAAQYLLKEGMAEKICFVKTDAMSGYSGYRYWKEELVRSGADQSSLEFVPPVPAHTDILHTRIEAESMVHFAKKQSYKSVIVTAPPFHQPRAFMAAVTAVIKIHPELKLYSFAGKALPWCQEVAHSQGAVQDTRAGLIVGEIERIHKYQAKGDLASINEVLEYLNKRDK